MTTLLRERIAESVSAIHQVTSWKPEVGIVLGTGLGGLAEQIAVEVEIGYDQIPGFPTPTVELHAGRLLCGRLGGRRIVAMQGRFHRYEGFSLQDVTFPIRVMRALGASTLVVSGACGGMHPLWQPGELVLIADHVNLLGDNPLVGPNDDRLGARFPDLSRAYDPDLRALAREIAREERIVLHEGVYAAVTGPSLETAAEYRSLRSLGADVVGMSMVPEVIVAVHAGMRVLGCSIITDSCLPDALEPVDVPRIVATALAAEPELTALLTGVLTRMA